MHIVLEGHMGAGEGDVGGGEKNWETEGARSPDKQCRACSVGVLQLYVDF